jgi:hypothetical protein
MAEPDPTEKLLDELLEGNSPEQILGEKGSRLSHVSFQINVLPRFV